MAKAKRAKPTQAEKALAALRKARRDHDAAFASEAEMRERVTLTNAELKAWNKIAMGQPMKNSQAVLQAIKMKMDMTFSKPAQKIDADGKLQIEILNLASPDAPVSLTLKEPDPPPPTEPT